MSTDHTSSTLTTDLAQMEQRLALEAQLFCARRDTRKRRTPQAFIVADFEYAYDRERHRGYLTAEDVEHETFNSKSEKDKRMKLRWPFHHIAAASWTILRFRPGAEAPEIDTPVVFTASDYSELDITEAFFAALTCEPGAVMVTWGGEYKDLAVLRRSAGEYGLVLPMQLRDLKPHATSRIDLCNEVSVRAESVHLPEYAHACSIPAKPSPSKTIGKLVENALWEAVKEQVLADVMTAAVIAVRHLTSHGIVKCKPQQTMLALAQAMILALPASAYFSRTVKRWAENELVQTKLKGIVYRAA